MAFITSYDAVSSCFFSCLLRQFLSTAAHFCTTALTRGAFAQWRPCVLPAPILSFPSSLRLERHWLPGSPPLCVSLQQTVFHFRLFLLDTFPHGNIYDERDRGDTFDFFCVLPFSVFLAHLSWRVVVRAVSPPVSCNLDSYEILPLARFSWLL